MPWRRIYERFKNQVLRQQIGGTYRKEDRRRECRTLFWMGLLNIALGAMYLASFLSLPTLSIPYASNTRQQIFLTKGRHNMYIEIDQLFQNNLTYTKSISYDQLKGETDDLSLSDMKPYDYVDGRPYYPAGLVANTYFQDLIRIRNADIRTTGIAWDSEKKVIGRTGYAAGDIAIPEAWTPSTNRGSVPLNTTPASGLPILDERFVNWIYLSTFAHFRKLWGVVNVPRDGSYELDIESIFDFSGKKLYFTKGSWLGTKNYLFVGGLVLIGLSCILGSTLLKRIGQPV